MKKGKTLDHGLRREEWDFTTVPEFELEACFRYEMTRKITEYRAFLVNTHLETSFAKNASNR